MIARPALKAGAQLAQRPRPPLIVSAPILLTRDFATVREVAQVAFSVYSSLPTYRKMFREANFPLTAQGQLSDEFIDEVFIYGDEETIRERLLALHQAGADETVTSIRPVAEPAREEAAILEILIQVSM